MLPEKRWQTYDEALRAMQTPGPAVHYLKQISIRFYTEELLSAALKNHRGSLRELRKPKRTKTLCHVVLEACRDAEVEFIPDEYFDLAFAKKAASFCPKALRTILYRFRSQQGRGPFTPYTVEDVKIIAEAACPKGLGQYKLSGVKNQEQELAGRTFEQYCSEVYGYVDAAYTYVYKQALDVLLQHYATQAQGDETT